MISRSSFSDFASKYGKDERFKAIEKMREREGIFSDFVSDLRRKEKEEKSQQKEKVGTRKVCLMCVFLFKALIIYRYVAAIFTP